jgi:hypothetical protein
MTTASYALETITFPIAFTGPNPPVVLASFGGDRTAAQGAGVYGQGGNNVHGNVMAAAMSPSLTGFQIKAGNSAGGAYSNGDTVYYQWVAIGS